MDGGLVFGVVVVLLFFGLLAFLAFHRYMGYRETLALAEKGLLKVELEHKESKSSLRWGLVFTAIGAALTLSVYPIGFVVGFNVRDSYPLHFGPWMIVGLLPLFFGIALILINVLTREKQEKPEDKSETSVDTPMTQPTEE